MATSSIRRNGPVALSALLDSSPERMGPLTASDTGPARGRDRILYDGSDQEGVPKALFLDRRLTPLERNAWQVIWLQFQEGGAATLPTYDQLRAYLASMPCGGPASHETVARALTLLRLTRWLSLVRRPRDSKTGRLLGNVYVLHAEPVTSFEAAQLDPNYLILANQALVHAAKAVRIVALNTLKEIAADPQLGEHALPARFQELVQHAAEQGKNVPGDPQETNAPDFEEGEDARLRNFEKPSSESEPRRAAVPDSDLRNSKMAPAVCGAPGLGGMETLRIPDRFVQLKDEQRNRLLLALQQVNEASRQAVLDEWAARCRGNNVRSPAGYLFGIIQKALRGEFKAHAGVQDTASAAEDIDEPHPAPLPPFPPAAPSPVASPEVIQACLARLRSSWGKA